MGDFLIEMRNGALVNGGNAIDGLLHSHQLDQGVDVVGGFVAVKGLSSWLANRGM